MRGGTSIRGPESQEGGRESQTGPLALAIDILFIFFHFLEYFQLKSSILREVSVCPWSPKAVLFSIAKFLFEALTTAPIYRIEHISNYYSPWITIGLAGCYWCS